VTQLICGVDVSSQALDFCLGRNGPSGRVPLAAEGLEQLIRLCVENHVDLVVMEATGGYEKIAFSRLWQAGVPTAIVNPRSVRWFAEAMGFLEKTDKIDAGLIAWYAEVKRIMPQPPAPETQDRLRALVTRLRQITELRTGQLNQRRLVHDDIVSQSFQELIAVLNAQIRVLESKIAALLDADPLWARLDQSFRTVKGVADRTVSRIMAELPEIGTLSNKPITKLVGLAPIANDSGKRSGKRPIRGGRADLRSLLYVVAHVVARHEPDFIEFRQRLSDAGKPKKVIRIAVAHKLLVRLNAKARDTRLKFAPAA